MLFSCFVSESCSALHQVYISAGALFRPPDQWVTRAVWPVTRALYLFIGCTRVLCLALVFYSLCISLSGHLYFWPWGWNVRGRYNGFIMEHVVRRYTHIYVRGQCFRGQWFDRLIAKDSCNLPLSSSKYSFIQKQQDVTTASSLQKTISRIIIMISLIHVIVQHTWDEVGIVCILDLKKNRRTGWNWWLIEMVTHCHFNYYYY